MILLLCFVMCYHRTKKAWRTVNPEWNESFLFDNNSFRLHSAAYLQLIVLDKSRKGSKDEVMGVVFIPLSDCFSRDAVAGRLGHTILVNNARKLVLVLLLLLLVLLLIIS
jgi:Ca2+-dependent lipid-binding protein